MRRMPMPRGMGGCFERFMPGALQGVDKVFAVFAQIAVGVQQGFDHIGHFGCRKRRAYDFAGFGLAAQHRAI